MTSQLGSHFFLCVLTNNLIFNKHSLGRECTNCRIMNADYKTVLIESLKSFDAKTESNVEKAVSLVAESIAMAYTKADLAIQEKTFLETLKRIQECPNVLNLEKTSEMNTSTILEAILSYFKRYEFGIAQMQEIINGIKA